VLVSSRGTICMDQPSKLVQNGRKVTFLLRLAWYPNIKLSLKTSNRCISARFFYESPSHNRFYQPWRYVRDREKSLGANRFSIPPVKLGKALTCQNYQRYFWPPAKKFPTERQTWHFTAWATIYRTIYIFNSTEAVACNFYFNCSKIR